MLCTFEFDAGPHQALYTETQADQGDGQALTHHGLTGFGTKSGFDVRQKSRLSIRSLVTKAGGGSHLSCQKSKMPETSAVCHLDNIAAYSMRRDLVCPLFKKGGKRICILTIRRRRRPVLRGELGGDDPMDRIMIL